MLRNIILQCKNLVSLQNVPKQDEIIIYFKKGIDFFKPNLLSFTSFSMITSLTKKKLEALFSILYIIFQADFSKS